MKWPYCDGVHECLNKEYGSNVGPLRLKSGPWGPKPKAPKCWWPPSW